MDLISSMITRLVICNRFSYNHFHFLQLPRVGYTAGMEGHDADPALSPHLFMLLRIRLTLNIVLLCPRPFYAP